MSDKTSIPQIAIVPATAEDYEEIISISRGLFNGTDYMPFRYHSWLKEPQRRMFVAKSEGKVVGFESFLLVDDGTTVVMEGLRVAPWMRGHGVTKLMEKFCWKTIYSDHPEVKRVRFAQEENPPASLLSLCKTITCKTVITVFLPAEKLETIVNLLESRVTSLDRSKNLSVLGPEEILRFFEDSKTREQLLPGGLLIQCWCPLTTHKSNLNLLLKQQIVWIYSASSSKITTSCDSTHAYPEGFLSLGTPPYPVPFAEGTYCLDIDMFGNYPSCAKVHVVQQLKIGVQSLPAGSSIICILYADKSLHTELEQLCEGLTPFPNTKEEIVLEFSYSGKSCFAQEKSVHRSLL